MRNGEAAALVVNAENQARVEGAEVQLKVFDEGRIVGKRTTDFTGAAFFSDVPPGVYFFEVTAENFKQPEYDPERDPFLVPAGGHEYVTVSMLPQKS